VDRVFETRSDGALGEYVLETHRPLPGAGSLRLTKAASGFRRSVAIASPGPGSRIRRRLGRSPTGPAWSTTLRVSARPPLSGMARMPKHDRRFRRLSTRSGEVGVTSALSVCQDTTRRAVARSLRRFQPILAGHRVRG